MISYQTDLRQLIFPDGLRDNPKAILGIAAGAHALNKSVEQSAENEKVLIHCNAGKERTPSTVAYYLIRYCGFQGNDAVALVKSAFLERNKGDIEDSSLYLPHYYGWLRTQTPDSLITYEQNTLANIKNVQAPTIKGQLPFLYESIDNQKLGTICFKIKKSLLLIKHCEHRNNQAKKKGSAISQPPYWTHQELKMWLHN
jgi:Swiss Army Knife protein, DSP-PTPase phosphatase domain